MASSAGRSSGGGGGGSGGSTEPLMPQPRRLQELQDGGSADSSSGSGSSSAATYVQATPSPNTSAKEGEPLRMVGEGGIGADIIADYKDDPYRHIRQQAEQKHCAAVERRRSCAGMD